MKAYEKREISMSNKLQRNYKKKESVWAVAKDFTAYVLDGIICVFMALIIVVMPFYNKNGYTYIGTDKAQFLRNIGIYGLWFVAPMLTLYFIFAAAVQIQKCVKEKGNRKESIFTGFAGLLRARLQKLSLTDKFALLYCGGVILSYVCSDYKETAFWGTTGWYMGFFVQLTLLAIYFLISRFWSETKWLLWLFLPASAAVFLLGYLNRFGIYPIDMELQHAEFISTIGNMNWYCGYLVSVFFGGYYLLWQSGSTWNRENAAWKRWLLMAYVAVGFATLVTQGSMSGIVTLAVMLVVTFCFSVKDSRKMLLFWQETLLLSLMCLVTFCIRTIFGGQLNFQDGIVDLLTDSVFPVIAAAISALFVIGIMRCEKRRSYPVGLFRILARIAAVGSGAGAVILIGMITLNTLFPGSLGALSEYPVFTFTPDWGSNRGATWRAGVICFQEQDFLHKLVGVGPDCMGEFLNQSANAELKNMLAERFGVLNLRNAHNEWLTVLVNNGIIGFVGFVGMMVSAIGRFLRYGLKGGQAVIGACGFCLLAYTVNNMFSFQQAVNTATIFVILGIGEACVRKHTSLLLPLFSLSAGTVAVKSDYETAEKYIMSGYGENGLCRVCFLAAEMVK